MRFVAFALVLTACGPALVPPDMIVGDGMPDRLYCVQKNAAGMCRIFRSAQPTAAQFIAMRDHLMLRSSLKLNYAWEARDAVPQGVELVDDPMSSVFEPDQKTVDQICADLDEAPIPTLIHCTAGRERTGFIVEMCVRNKQKPIGPSADAMYNEWIAFGMRPVIAPGLIEAFKKATGWHE